ncbi:MAG: hypothetical protein E6Q76_07485 [Rhizobium sp.]|nr:MAG: hypothetical protein E6Q76_07485 [Rhizobium sp.]
MLSNKFRETWTSLKTENKFTRLIVVGLLAANLILVTLVASTKPIVVLTPPTLEKASTIEARTADENFKKAWALFLADLMGSITPANVDFIVESLSLYLSSNVYNTVKAALYDQAREVRTEGMTITFSPKEVSYEQSTGKVFVYGNNRTERRGGRADNIDRTYEFIVSMQNYRPVITRMSVYRGPPLTSDKLQAMQEQKKTPDAAVDTSTNPTTLNDYQIKSGAPSGDTSDTAPTDTNPANGAQ